MTLNMMRFYVIVLLLLNHKVYAGELTAIELSKQPKFVQLLMYSINQGRPIAQHVATSLTFIHSGYDRCIDDFKGAKQLTPGTKIDTTFTITIRYNGGGWACEEKPPSTYTTTLDFTKILTSDYSSYEFSQKKLSWTIYNDSQIIEFFFAPKNSSTKDYEITKIIYSIEDPG